MRASLRHLIGFALVATLVAGVGCATKKPKFNPEPVTPAEDTAAAGAGANAGGAQPIGAEGFKDKQLQPAEQTGGGGVGEITPDQLAAALKTVYFAYDSDELSGEALQTLNSDAAWLKQHPRVKVQVEGHTDERGTIQYNLELGARRARNVKQQLIRLGVPAEQLDTISYGKERPAMDGHDESAWSKNRRAEFKLAAG